MAASLDKVPGRTRIESWKEIASFFGRDERTVKRWEKSRRLPVRRLPGSKSGVFAYSDELLHWLDSRSSVGTQSSAHDTPHELSILAGRMPGAGAIIAPWPIRAWHRKLLWFTPVVAVLLIVVFATYRLHTLHKLAARGAPASLPAAPNQPASPAAELYLRGRYYWSHRTEGTLRQAVDAFTQAVARDPKYAPAYAGLADSYNVMPEYTGMSESKAFPIAIAAARRAVSLDDSLAEAHRALAYALFSWDWDADQSFREFRRAAQLDPTDEDTHAWFARALYTLGRYAEAKTEMERARQLEPTSRSVLASQGLVRYWAGERDLGIAQLQELETSEPDFSAPPRYLAIIYFDDRNYPAYIDQLKRLAALSRNPRDAALASAAEAGWKRNGALGLLEEMRTVQLESFRKGESSGYDLAAVCARLGRRQEADQYLEAAFKARDPHAIQVLRGDFDTDMRADQHFEKLKRAVRQRVKFPAANAAK
jgi:tetratricopeptide (TPR) repeat protein